MKALSRSVLINDLRNNAFAAPGSSVFSPGRIGAEAELIPVETHTGCRCEIEGDGSTATLPFLRRYGQRQRWKEERTRGASWNTARPRAGLRAIFLGSFEAPSSRCAPLPRWKASLCWRPASIP
jgi:hypothetical protein